MTRFNAPFEIHVHGDVPLREDIAYEQVEEALKPLWRYAGASSLASAAGSHYEDEPGIRIDVQAHVLHMCWTVTGDDDFRQAVEETCMGINDLAASGAPIEVSFYDAEYDEDDESNPAEARDDFMMCFVGPTPAAIMQIQRDLLVQDVVGLMERHFETTELTEVVTAIDNLFTRRFDDLVNSMQLGRPPRGGHGGPPSGHGGPRKPRHLH
ncbi:DUF6806 family protein [Hydrogenophaga sp. 5NK40-0174]|uniref:DUF6806 family protein n=1 Tax=Hydrogenophaga sp. 5NK40-0174 TaxID=3127649 RepID=UPI00310661D4